MRILITGATSAVGRAAAAQLVAAGHRVCGVAHQPHALLDPRVDLVCAALSDPVLQVLTDAADVVVHLAPIEAGLPDSAGIAGVVRVTHAAARAGARLVFVSHAAGEAELYRQAEDLVTSCWAPSLIIRIALPVGRQADWMVCRTAATLLTADITRPVRVLHTDDLHRFIVRSVGSHRTGSVDLATSDAVTPVTARRWLGSIHPRAGRIGVWAQPETDLRVLPLQRDWEFECGWTAADALADMGRALSGQRIGAPAASGGFKAAGLLPLPVDLIPRDTAGAAGLRRAASGDQVGEFDNPIDPQFPLFSTRSTSDALPGPLTPMTLDVHGSGLRAAHRATAEIMGLDGGLAREWQQRAVAVFGHRIFTGVSVTLAVAAALPGGDLEALNATLLDTPLDRHAPTRDRHPLSRPVADAALAARIIGIARRYEDWCREFAAASAQIRLDATGWASLRDAALEVRIRLLRNRIHHGWTLSAVGVLTEGLLTRAAGHKHAVVPLLAATTATAHLSDVTAAMAENLRGDRRLRDLAAAGDLAAIHASYPAVTAALDAAMTRVGHRGPGEAELAHPVLADSPGQLLAAAALAAHDTAAPPPGPVPGSGHRRTESIRIARESAWDTTARYTHQLRMALRELGSRRAATRILADADDAFYVTLDEILSPPVDARLRVKHRRAEHERLQALTMPDVIDGRWAPVEDATPRAFVTVMAASTDRAPKPSLEPQGQA